MEVKRVRPDDAVGARHVRDRRGHVIIEPAVLIIRNQQGHLFPLGARPQRLVHLLHEPLSERHVVRRVIIVRRKDIHIEVTLLHHHVIRQLAQFGV